MTTFKFSLFSTLIGVFSPNGHLDSIYCVVPDMRIGTTIRNNVQYLSKNKIIIGLVVVLCSMIKKSEGLLRCSTK